MNRARYALLIILIAAADQGSKLAISEFMRMGQEIRIIPGFFNLVHIRNPGAAFGIFADLDPVIRRPILLGISLVGISVIAYLFFRSRAEKWKTRLSLALILGGVISNTAERLFSGAVLDFLDFHVADFHWPAFNLADMGISVGMVLLIAHTLVEDETG